jgi:hypothetical protein
VAHLGVVRLLSALELLPLEKCTSDAAEWRQDIANAIRELQATAMPPDDPLWYGAGGERLSRVEFGARLQMIIDSWPSMKQEKKRGRKKAHSRSR